MNLFSRINVLLASRETQPQLDKFVEDLRSSIAGSASQFIAYPVLIVVALTTYLFATRLGTSVTFSGVQLADATLVRRVFLVVPAALITAHTSVGYLRKAQRVVYAHIALPRYLELSKAGLHELRLPSDYIAGLYLLHEEGGKLGKVISLVVIFLVAFCFLLGPIAFIISESIENIRRFGIKDVLSLAASLISIVLCVCSLLIVRLTGNIKVEAPEPSEISGAP